MNIQLPYENPDLNVQYLIAKNTEVNTTSSMITLCFFIMLFIMYNLSHSVINNYKSKNLQLHYIIYLINKVNKLGLDLTDLPKLVKTLEEQNDKLESESESESDAESGSDDDLSENDENETINLMVTLDQNSRRVLRSHTKNLSDSNLVIKGKGWKLD